MWTEPHASSKTPRAMKEQSPIVMGHTRIIVAQFVCVVHYKGEEISAPRGFQSRNQTQGQEKICDNFTYLF